MAENFSYSNDPSASPLDAVRFLTGDVNPRDPQLTDSEINYLVSVEGTALLAAIAACVSIAGRYSRELNASDDKTSREREVLATHYRDLADDLRRRRIAVVAPYAGGISMTDKAANQADGDLVQPTFTKNLQDNRRAGSDPTCR